MTLNHPEVKPTANVAQIRAAMIKAAQFCLILKGCSRVMDK